jgi:hypothetical protein
MKYLKIFEEYSKYQFKKSSKTYEFDDFNGNIYKVVFHGPHEDIDDDIQSGITYDLDFFTQEKDYKKLTNAGVQFTVSSFIFNDILTDFIKNNKVDTISIFPTEPNEGVKRFDKKQFTKYELYLRSLKNNFKLPGWKIVPIEREKFGELEKSIIVINSESKFWKGKNNFPIYKS